MDTKQLRLIRKIKGLTLEGCSKTSGVSVSTLIAIEAGRPSAIGNVERYANVLGMGVAFITLPGNEWKRVKGKPRGHGGVLKKFV